MSAITNCPSCQTQFVVTEEQLNQHNGKVRCGQCLHVFNARNELVETNLATEAQATSTEEVENHPALETTTIAEINQQPEASALDNEANDIVNEALNHNRQESYFNDVKSKTKAKTALVSWIVGFFTLILLLAAMAQTIYFLRTKIATYYPATKVYLIQACEKIGCSIELPKKIDLIVIDDSDMQEDAEAIGLIHLTSTLINQASFTQAYPNIELTLTDIEDSPKLRRIFKPNEYLLNHHDVAKGLAAGEELKVKLAITAEGESVAGYRIFVSY